MIVLDESYTKYSIKLNQKHLIIQELKNSQKQLEKNINRLISKSNYYLNSSVSSRRIKIGSETKYQKKYIYTAMNFGERPGNEIIQISTKTVVLKVIDDTANNKFMNTQLNGNKKGVGSFNIQNISQRNSLMYKIRSNRPKNYSLSNPYNVIEPNKIAFIDLKLQNTSLFTSKDRFEINYVELTQQLVQIQNQQRFLNNQEFWKFIEQNNHQFPIKQSQINVELQEGQSYNKSQTLNPGIQINYQNQFSVPALTSPSQFKSISPSLSNHSLSPFNARQNKNSIFQSTRGDINTPIQSTDQGMLVSPMKSQDKYKMTPSLSMNQSNANYYQQENIIPGLNSTQMIRKTSVIPPGAENDYKWLYEKLVIKVDEQDKQLFVLNQERKKLDQDWKLLSKKQEQLKNSEFQEQKLKNINGIQPVSALIIMIISLLIGIYLGN